MSFPKKIKIDCTNLTTLSNEGNFQMELSTDCFNVCETKEEDGKDEELISKLKNEIKELEREIEHCNNDISDRIDTTTFICDRIGHYSDYHKKITDKLTNTVNKLKSELEVEQAILQKNKTQIHSMAEKIEVTSNRIAQLTGENSDLMQSYVAERNVTTEFLNGYSSRRDAIKNIECSICADTIIDPVITKCKHTFCSTCLFEWLLQKMECALCKQRITPPLIQSAALSNSIEHFIETVAPEELDVRAKRREALLEIRKHKTWKFWFSQKYTAVVPPFNSGNDQNFSFQQLGSVPVLVEEPNVSRAQRRTRRRRSRRGRRNRSR